MKRQTGKKISDIDHLQIHAILNEIPYVSETDIQTDLRGNITIELSLRKAIIRVINNAGFTYYLDTEGMLMPVNPGHPSRVIIFNGAIKDGLSELKGKFIYFSLLQNLFVRAGFQTIIIQGFQHQYYFMVGNSHWILCLRNILWCHERLYKYSSSYFIPILWL